MHSLIIPAYNEEKRIEKTIKSLLRLKSFELIFVVDGTDRTASIVKHYAKKHKNVRLFPSINKGKWGAILYGINKAKNNFVGFVDADLPVNLIDINRGFNLISKADIVIGSRNIKGSKAKRVLIRRVYSRLFNLYVRLLYKLPFFDTQCGFKVFNKNSLKKLLPLKSNSWETDVEILYRARRKGLIIKELPVTWNEVSGSKLNFKSMVLMVINLFKLRFSL